MAMPTATKMTLYQNQAYNNFQTHFAFQQGRLLQEDEGRHKKIEPLVFDSSKFTTLPLLIFPKLTH